MKTTIATTLFFFSALFLLSSCAKETAEPVQTGQKQVIIRIKQVQKDGTVTYSPRVRVQVRSVM
ncbi:hypothetical protein L0U88_07415 [Flavihumibacter sp. RY-1]|uniref:Uncharacterized protein n=1 Tax=Flavihumibacter fluminis TaxID=2909236 RepID=A0ABS9BFS3_9BACT|nr:hypothetical protein [Flavihumibacter fluminis]MCF1714452.1 hypothetical protein [Flavihumibacter fluminis]